MSQPSESWEPGLDQPGSAGPVTLRLATLFATLIVVAGLLVAALGRTPLTPLPGFTMFHAAYVFVVDGIAAFLLFTQFAYRRMPVYLVLAAAFLFSSLIMVPFLLSYPGVFTARGGFIGGPQSSIWVWHFWHILFPALVALALVVHERGRPVTGRRSAPAMAAAGSATVLLVLLLTLVVTVYHEHLPALITEQRVPLSAAFYWVGGFAAAVTVAALLLALRMAQTRTVLHIWLAVLLLAWLSDVAASLGAGARYTVGWYFGRIDSMFATSALLVVLLGEIHRVYRRLAERSHEVLSINRELAASIREKDALLAELQQREEQIRRLAYHDPTTDLPNRRLLMEELTTTLARAARHHHSTGLLFLDLDNFKEVNDRLGHEAGDALLREVAARLRRCVRAGDTVSRLGGDEFVIVLPEITGLADATAVADKVLDTMRTVVDIAGQDVLISVSVGVAMARGGAQIDADELVRQADEAMYAAKKAGRNRYCLSGA